MSYPLRIVARMAIAPLPSAVVELNPAQHEALQLIREPRSGRPQSRAELRGELRAVLEEGLASVAGELEQPLSVSKHQLGSVHGCEERFAEEAARPFAATAATVRGAVAHKAIELSLANLPASPARLVDRAMARLTDGEDWSGAWLRQSDDVERAEVRALAVDRVTKFVECFPPLQPGWRPVTESRWHVELCDGRIVLRGKVDLTIGAADGLRASKVIVDFKTGSRAISHLEDLRFYALVETLRLGVPPWKVASYYLDAGSFQAEVVTEGMLEAAARRVIAGVTKIVELKARARPPARSTGPTCTWCPLVGTCKDGQRAKAAWEEW